MPPVFLLCINGTGDPRFDGKRATASPMIPDVLGHFQFDWFRHRRELRGLRLAAAWLNDTDRGPNNNLVTQVDGAAHYYFIDFNSALGSWQGRPKEPWRRLALCGGFGRGPRGLADGGFDPARIQSTATGGLPGSGRFDADYDPLTWAPQVANGAFDRMTSEDRDWMIERIARLQAAAPGSHRRRSRAVPAAGPRVSGGNPARPAGPRPGVCFTKQNPPRRRSAVAGSGGP